MYLKMFISSQNLFKIVLNDISRKRECDIISDYAKTIFLYITPDNTILALFKFMNENYIKIIGYNTF